jgi:hypothetical protein
LETPDCSMPRTGMISQTHFSPGDSGWAQCLASAASAAPQLPLRFLLKTFWAQHHHHECPFGI